MCRRRLFGVGAVALLGVVGFVTFLWLTSPNPGASWDNFRRFREGMPVRDVEALLGKPCEVYESPTYPTRCWRGEEVEISLTFFSDTLLCGYADLSNGDREYIRRDETFLDRIRRWLHW